MDQDWLGLIGIIAYSSKQEIIQNLIDAGCESDMIDGCMQNIANGKKDELLKCLENHRVTLLHKVHENEKQIDCLDYFIFQINRSKHQ